MTSHSLSAATVSPRIPLVAFQRCAQGLGLAVLGLGLLVLVGWACDIGSLRSVWGGWVDMKANTALAFAFAGGALWLQGWEPNPAPRLGRLLAGGTALIGLLTLGEYVFGWDLGIDQVLFHEDPLAIATYSPGRMALTTAVCFTCVGLALVFLGGAGPRRRQAGQWLLLPVAGLALLAAIGYLFNQPAFYQFSAFTTMAFHTTLGFLALSLGIGLARPDHELVVLLADAGPGGIAARRLLPTGILAPIVLGWLRVQGERAGYYQSEMGPVLTASCYIIILVLLVWWITKSLRRVELQRQQTEQTLRESEARFRTLANNLPAVVARFDRQLRYLYVNPAVEPVTGIRAQAFIGKTNQELGLPVAKIAQWHHALEQVFLTGRAAPLPFSFPGPTGTTFWDGQLVPELAADGRVETVLCINHNVTERQLVEDALRDKKREYQELIANLSCGIVVHAADTAILFANAPAAQLFGLSEAQMQGKMATDPAWNFLQEDGTPVLPGEYPVNQVLTSGQPLKNQVFGVRRPDQAEPAWLLCNAHPVRNAAGELWQVIVNFVDVTERRHAELRLRLALVEAQRFREALDHVSSFIYMKDGQSRYVYANQPTLKLFGCSAAELVGSDDARFFPPGIVKRLRKVDARVFRGEPTSEEINVVEKDGQRRVYWEVKTPIYAEPERQTICGLLGISTDITERKQAEEALLASARFAHATVDALSVHLAILDETGAIIFVNRGWRTFSRTNSKVADTLNEGANYLAVCDAAQGPEAAEAAAFAAGIRAVLVGEQDEFTSEYACHSPSEKRWFIGRVTSFPAEAGRRIVVAHENITSLKLAEAEQRHNEARFRSLAKILQYRADKLQDFLDYALNEAIQLTGSKYGYLYFYHQTREQFALNTWSKDTGKAAHALHQNFCELNQTGFWGEAVRRRQPIIENQVKNPPPLPTYPPGHATPLHRYLAIPVFNRNQIVAVVAVVNKADDYDAQDTLQLNLLMDAVWKVVEQREAAMELAASEERFRRAVMDSPFPIMLHAEDGTILQVSNSWCEISGYAREEITTMAAWLARAYGEQSALMQTVINETYGLEHRLAEGDYPIRTKSGATRIWDFSSAPMGRLPDGRRVVISMAMDVTERKQAEVQRQNMEIQLRQAQKLESIGQLAAGIAHEINTPTQYVGDNTRFLQDSFGSFATVLQAYAGLLQATKTNLVTPALVAEVEAALAAADLEYLAREIPVAIKETLEGIERVTKIVQAMKEFSHPGGKEKAPADLNKAIETTVTVARNEWKYVADLELDLDPLLPLVPCFVGEFNQCILNLLVNAAHAIGDQAKVQPGTRGQIRVGTRCVGEQVEVRVADTGTGIPEAARAKIFEPFFTTKQVGRGTGQGLLIVYTTIVKKHGGTVTFETEIGRGTTFILRLPLKPQVAPPSEPGEVAIV